MAVITGTSGPDDLLPNDGEDDRIDGLGDFDRVGYAAVGQAFAFLIAASGRATGADGEIDTIANIESFAGSNFGDTFTVDASFVDHQGVARATIFGNGGDDVAAGGVGDDYLQGDGGADLLRGGLGDDTLVGDGASIAVGADMIFGGAGDDEIFAGPGDDLIDGGDGAHDLANYGGGVAGAVVNLSSGVAMDGDGGVDSLAGIEDIGGTAHDDILIGDAGANTIFGFGGDDRLAGRGGADRMFGGAGDDIYDVTDASAGAFENAGEGDRDRANVFVDFVSGGEIEFIVGKFASMGLALTGSDGRESIAGAARITSPDTIHGMGGNDKLIGLVGNDELFGDAGNDRIFGNSGDDVIAGGTGNDRMTGRFGADRYVHAPGDGRDIVTDFDVTEDLLDLTAHNFASHNALFALADDVAAGLLIDLAGPDSVLLAGVVEADLGMADVLI